MSSRERTVYVLVVLAVPAVSVLLWGFFLAVVSAGLLAFAVSTAHFSDGNSTVPTTLGSCEPFCALRSDPVPVPPVGGKQR